MKMSLNISKIRNVAKRVQEFRGLALGKQAPIYRYLPLRDLFPIETFAKSLRRPFHKTSFERDVTFETLERPR